MRKNFTLQLLIFVLVAFSSSLFAEGTHGLSPTEDDNVMLLVNDSHYGYFAGYDGPENSRLYFTVNDVSEIVYLGFSSEYNASGSPFGLGYFEYRIKRKSDGAIVFGPFQITSIDANLSSWQDAVAGPAPITGADGYDTSDEKYTFEPETVGDYYIEFSGLKFLGLWDITVAKDNVAQNGRVWSKNWAFRTPATTNELPECVWSKEFNAALYSYTTDGFVSKVDFQNSGFQGLSFNVAFNTTGPRNTGNTATDRQSVADVNLTENAGEHQIFLNEPDPLVFPDGDCGNVEVADYFNCDGEGGYCIPVSVSNPGLVELILDFDGNGVYDVGTEDVLLLYNFTQDTLNYCVPWDGLKGTGEPVEFGDHVNLEFSFFQGIQHWSVYDGEYLKNGFCVEVIRPVCDPEIVINSLHWDDRNIPDDPGTGQPKDGRFGCSCQTAGCRTWNNFDPNTESCSSVNDNNTTGYGDRTTLNTWWYASIVNHSNIDVPLLTSRLTIREVEGDDDGLICQGEHIMLDLEISSSSSITTIEWYGPNGLIPTTGLQLSIEVVGGGTYRVVGIDEYGCMTESSIFVDEIICPVDLELDKSVNNLNPQIGAVITFSITVNNNGPGGATGVSIVDELPSGYSNIVLGVNSNAVINGNTITWSDLSFDVGSSQTFTYSVTVGYGDYVNSAEIVAINEEDIDSTPGNGVDTDNDGDCSDDLGDEDDGDCVEVTPIPCSISATASNIICDPNGTPSISEDDTYSFSVIIEGESTQGGWTASNGQSGDYSELTSFGPYSIADQPQITLVFTDGGDDGCTTSVSVTAPETCSNECEILIGNYSVSCDDNDTPSIIEDDIFYVNITIDGRNVGAEWTSNEGGGVYGEEVQLGPFLILDGDLSLAIQDGADSGCTAEVFIEAPNACSDVCAITNIAINSVDCNNSGTPSIGDDDVFYATITVTGSNLGEGWTSSLGFSGNYNEPVTIGPFDISAGDITLDLTDIVDSECVNSIFIAAPETCSNECEILIGGYSVSCDDNDTPSIAEDDVFYVNITVDGRNVGSGWTSDGGGGVYGEETQVGPFLISAGDITLVVFDNDEGNCVSTVFVEAPASCSDACAITSIEIVGTTCNDNGTPSRADDDIFYATIHVDGLNLGSGWVTASGFSGNYNEDVTIGPFDISAGNVTVGFTDAQDGDCMAEVLIPAPEPCSFECEMLGEIMSVDCDDNGSPAMADDDVFFVTVLMSGFNLGSSWHSNTGAIGYYNEATTIGPFDISGGDVSIIIYDDNDNGCSITLLAEAPATCSDACLITAEVLGVECADLGNSETGFDDMFIYKIRVTGYNMSTEGWVASDGSVGSYGEVSVSVPHLIADGALNLTIADAGDNGGCITQVIIDPPALSMTCPEDTDEGRLQRPVQVLTGDLSPTDSAFLAGDSLCWLPMSNNGGHYYDMVSFKVSDEVDEYEKFTFILYTDMEVEGNTVSGMPENMYEGFGGLFFEEYMFDEPCCTVQSIGGRPLTIGEELFSSVNVDVTGIVPGNYHPVLTFTTSLIAEKDYTLITTTWLEQVFGHYKWVVVSEEESPLTVFGSNEFEFTEVQANVAYRLTFYDLTDDILNALPPMYTGMPTMDVECGIDEIRYEDALTQVDECDDAYISRNFTVVDVLGNETECTQEILFHRPTLRDVFFPPMTVHFGCNETYETDEYGMPLPSETGYPFIFTINGIEELTTGVHENIGVGIKDFEENENGELVTITREWTVVDICDNDTLARFSQLIKFDNYEMPNMVCPMNNHNCPFSEDGMMLIPTTAYDCFASAPIPMPEYEGGCGDTTNFEITTEVFHLLETGNELIATILPNEDRLVEGMELGEYLIRYHLLDFEGGTQDLDCYFRVVDLTDPVAICNSGMSVSLSELGQIFVPTMMINNQSYDNCGIDSILVRRLYTRDVATCDSLEVPFYSEWGDFVEIGCCDANQQVRVELRIVDVSGNENRCWSAVSVVDNTLPYCFGLADAVVDCEVLPYHFDANNTDQLQALFSLPQVYDNCTAEAVELQPSVNLTQCGTGTIIRRFIAIDLLGQQSIDTFSQIVTLEGDLQYEIKFPKDASTDCIHNADTLELFHTGCDSLVVFYTDNITTNTGNDACYLVERSYHVINYCEWDGISAPVVISRDEDCDGDQGEADVWVLVRPTVTYIDADSLANNVIPAANEKGTSCDGNSNPEGYWRTAISSGHWIYRQLLEVYDTIAPAVVYTVPDPICTDSLVCTAHVILNFKVEEACVAPVAVSVNFDAFSDGIIDEENVTVLGTYPNYYLEGDFEIGTHQYNVTVTDACSTTTANLVFEVVDCEIPAIDCQSGLLLNFVATEPNTDADGDGDIDEGAVEVWGYDLAGCGQDDCSGAYHFSVNRLGQMPIETQRSLMLTCDDRYSISLEVYVWDDAFNPYSVQPDGTIGGPNYDHCTVFILLSDDDDVCNGCIDILELAGEISTPETLTPIEGVKVVVDNYDNGPMFTSADGRYLVQDLELNQDYLLTPILNSNTKQGVTTADIIALQRHILGQLPLTSPYQLIAADVNRSGTVTFLDIVELRQLLLDDISSFHQSNSWTFIDAAYEFPDPANPWLEVFPEQIWVSNIESCHDNLDFYGVKIGDVNASALLMSENTDRNVGAPYLLKSLNTHLVKGETYDVSLYAKDINDVLGGQFALNFDLDALQFVGLGSGVINETYIGLSKVDDGLIKVSWDNVRGEKYDTDVLLTLRFKVKKAGEWQDFIALSNRDMSAEIYDKNLSVRPLVLSFDTDRNSLSVWQNKPNPFKEETMIVYQLSQDSEVSLQVTDMMGRVVYKIQRKGVRGENEIIINKANLGGSGVYYYTISNGEMVVMKPMIVLD